jgi:hypothetical protein
MGGTRQDRAPRPGGISRSGASARMRTATEATPEMAAYFLGALRDQSSRAGVFQRQLRWQRLRYALATEEALVADQHVLEAHLAEVAAARVVAATVVPLVPLEPPVAATVAVTTRAEPPEPSQAAAG